MFDDAWLTDLLRSRGGLLTDAGVAQGLAASLAVHRPVVDGTGAATRELLAALADTWERGWQPADVVHAARTGATAAVSVPLVVALIAEHARSTDAAARAPETWLGLCASSGYRNRTIPVWWPPGSAGRAGRPRTRGGSCCGRPGCCGPPRGWRGSSRRRRGGARQGAVPAGAEPPRTTAPCGGSGPCWRRRSPRSPPRRPRRSPPRRRSS